MNSIIDWDKIEMLNPAIGRAKLGVSGGGIPDAPVDGNLYGRKNASWITVPASGIPDAPSDGTLYGRKNASWSIVPAGGVPEAPTDGAVYARQNSAWVAVLPVSPAPAYAWWKLNDGVGTSAADASGSGRTGTLINTPVWTTGPNSNGALGFNGSTQHVDIATQSWSATGLSISCWAKRPWTSAAYAMFLSFNYAQNNGLALFEAGGASQDWGLGDIVVVGNGFGFNNNPRGAGIRPGVVDNGWHHVVGVIGPNDAQCYWDGQPLNMRVAKSASVTAITTQTIQMGAATGTSNFFGGTLDDVRIYDRVLTPQEVSALYFAKAQ